LKSTSGDLLIDGVRVNTLLRPSAVWRVVFQSYALYPHMNVAENMAFSLKLAGIVEGRTSEEGSGGGTHSESG